MRLLNTLLWLWAACVVVVLGYGAVDQWPGLHHDAVFYTSPIIRSAALGRWEYDAFVPGFIVYGRTTFDMHGQLYQFVFAKILRCDSYRALIAWSSVLNVVTYVAYLLVSLRGLRERHQHWAMTYASGIASVAALACVHLEGRPEHLLPLLMLIPFALRQFDAFARFARWSAYVVLGLVVVLSPIPGAICLLGVVTWIALRTSGRALVLEVVKCGVVSLASALLVLLIAAPVAPVQWLINTAHAGSTAGFVATKASAGLGAFGSAAIFDLPLWNVFALATFALVAVGLVRRRVWWLLAALAVVFVRLLGPMQLYSWLGFLSVMMFALVHDYVGLLHLPRSLRLAPRALVIGFGILASAALFRAVLLAVLYARGGVQFSDTEAKVRELERSLAPGERIGFVWQPRPSFVAFSRPDKFLLSVDMRVMTGEPDTLLTTYEAQSHQRVTYVIVPQFNQIKAAPDTLGSGFSLVENGWVAERPRFLGVKLGGAWPGYQFALYRRRSN